MSKSALHKRVFKAINEDNTIVVDIEDVEGHRGFTEQYMLDLGLRRYDLKQLHKNGLALRGKDVKGTTMWVLIGRTDIEEKGAPDGGQGKQE